MTRFQLCLLAVFMLLVSNCVAGSVMDSTQVHSHFDTPQSAIAKEHKERILNHPIQRRVLGTQAKIMVTAVKAESEEKKPEPLEQEKQPGQTAERQDPTVTRSDPNVNPPVKANGDATDTEGVNADGANKGPEDPGADKSGPMQKDPTKDANAGGNPKEGGTDKEGNAKAKPPSADEVATENTTTDPVAEEGRTEGRNDSTSTSTHSPTETVRGSDSQVSVKAGALSFILSIGIVLPIFI